MSLVFISHSHENKDTARRIANYLRTNRTEVWIDEDEILVGDSIPTKVEKGLESSDFILVLLTRHSVQSGWVRAEIESKLGEEIATGKIAVLGLLAEKTDQTWSIPTLLANKKCADITDDFERGMRDVLAAIRGRALVRTPKSPELYGSYVLGFTLGKVAWHHGSALQLAGLKTQFSTMAAKLNVGRDLTDAVLETFVRTANLGDVLKNANRGLEAKQTLSAAIHVQQGALQAAAFRFGFDIIHLAPQLEFLEMAQDKPSAATPVDQLLQGMEEQFDNLCSNATAIGLSEKHVDTLLEFYSLATAGNAGPVREKLLEVGSLIERDLSPAAS